MADEPAYAAKAARSVDVVHLRSHVPGNPVAQRACTEYVAAGGRVVLFEAVLREGHVGRAAQRMHITPSAVSHQLAKLLGSPALTLGGWVGLR